MKNSSLNSKREKQPIYDQNREDIHRVKKSILHPSFSESQPEKAGNRAFFVAAIQILFDKKNRPIKFAKNGVQQVLYHEN